jgi:hypothetical protein
MKLVTIKQRRYWGLRPYILPFKKTPARLKKYIREMLRRRGDTWIETPVEEAARKIILFKTLPL